MHQALEMSEDDRRKRMQKMRNAVADNNVYRWAGKLVSELTRAELRDWLHNRQQLFTHSIEIDGMTLSMVNPEVLDGTSAVIDEPRVNKQEAG